MKHEEFEWQLGAAILKMERLQKQFSRKKLAYAMTYEFYDKLKGYLLTDIPRTIGDPYGQIGEHYIGIINEIVPQPSPSILPVILGKEYNASMMIGDTIVVDDERRLFSLSSQDPVCFRDTGLTIRFNQAQAPSFFSATIDVPPDIFEILIQATNECDKKSKTTDKPSEDKGEFLDDFLDGFKVKQETSKENKKGEC